MAITENLLKAELTSIFVQGQKIASPKDTFLAKKINEFVQSNFFKTAAGSAKGTYRIVKTGDTITLEKKEGENWNKIQPPAPSAEEDVSTSSGDSSTDTPTNHAKALEPLKSLIGHFEHAAQKTVRSSWIENSCFLDAPYALLANIPSLRETVLNTQNLPDTARGLADSSSIKNGNDIRACFPDNRNIQSQDGGDPCDLITVLTSNTSLAQIDVTYPQDPEITKEELDRLDTTHKATLTDLQTKGFPLKHLALTTTTTEGENIDFSNLLIEFQAEKKIDIPADSDGYGAKEFKYKFTINHAKPLWIQINRLNDRSEKDNRPLTNVEFELEDGDENKLHLKGFIVHQGESFDRSSHYVAYYRKLDIKTGEYQWWEDNSLNQSAVLVNDESIQETLKQATHLYYDKDFYEDTTDNDDAISVHSNHSAESFESAIDEYVH